MSTESDSNPHHEGSVVCPKCLLDNSPTAAFCADCGAPIGMVANIDPIQHILSEGFAYRSAVEGPPKLIIVIGMWVIFAPIAFIVPFLLIDGFVNGLMETTVAILFAVCSVIVLYRTSKNYIVKSRLTNDRNA